MTKGRGDSELQKGKNPIACLYDQGGNGELERQKPIASIHDQGAGGNGEL